MKNQDGLEPGQPVDFSTLMRIKAAERKRKSEPKAEPVVRKKKFSIQKPAPEGE